MTGRIIGSALMLSVSLSGVTSAAFAGSPVVTTPRPPATHMKLPPQPPQPPKQSGGSISVNEGGGGGGGYGGGLGGLCDEVKCIQPK